MDAFWNDITNLQKFFLLIAFASGILLIFRVLLQILGVGDGDGGDFDIADGDAPDLGSTDAAGLHLFSLQGLSGFFLMFGLVGFALSYETKLHDSFSALGGVIAGALTLLLVAKITGLMLGLQSSGNIDINNAVGQEGTVYLRIPADSAGKVQVTVQERLRIFEAVSENKEELSTGDHVEVVGVFSGNVLVVKKV